MEEVLQYANSAPVWIISSIVVSIVIFQAFIFIRVASKTAPSIGMTAQETKSALRTGFISCLGPSFGIVVVIISLISVLGAPFTLMRIGIIGSAATELTAAGIGANAYGVELNSPDFDLKAFTTVVWTMCLGGCGWLLFAALFTKSLGKMQTKIVSKNAKMMTIVSTAAMLGAFGYLASQQMVKGYSEAVAGIVAGVSMMVLLTIANKKGIRWLSEWALGISLILALTIGYLSSLI
ncbi:DUF5058 family protein [Cytobacillus depressus]|uniref:DUF5058 family protein n=1 Tax=Cytobacillus depressus TaxID=1602942 RepID=A0A6L3VB98_9BACI|nr:DUF5058 family protein [Cytobacillus depressus]KAB2338047.1 DUF5058 family protein [Cytobacillus depressus]